MSPIRSCPRVASPRNFLPIRAIVTTDSGTTIMDTMANFQF